MLNYPYKARLLTLIGFCVEAAELDMFDGPTIYSSIFLFRATEPFNQIFEFFGKPDMNFMMNLSSLPIFFGLMFMLAIFYKFLKKIAKIGYKTSFCRKIGMYA